MGYVSGEILLHLVTKNGPDSKYTPLVVELR